MTIADVYMLHPTYPITTWGVSQESTAPTSGVSSSREINATFVTTPAHPWAGADGERYIKFDHDTTAGGHAFLNFNNSMGKPDGQTFPPDQTKRWARVFQFLFRHGESAGVGDSNLVSFPSPIAIQGSGVTAWTLYYNTNRTWTFTFGSFSQTGASVMTVNTNYLIEIWDVFNYSNGVARGFGNHQFVMRIMTPTGGSLTTEFDAINTSQASGIFTIFSLGTAPGASSPNCYLYIGSPAVGFKDADNPVIWRASQMVPNAAGVFSDFTTGTFADIDESGAAVPSSIDFTQDPSIDSSAVSQQMYNLTTPNYPVAGDGVMGVIEQLYCTTSDPGKTTTTAYTGISDATNTRYLLFNTFGSPPGSASGLTFWGKNPAGTDWVFGDLAGLQTGTKFATTTASPSFVTATIYTITAIVIYSNQTDTVTVVPGTGSPINASWMVPESQPFFEKAKAVAY